ncbi:ROK family protein [Actinoplanes cyaneus]|uniref:ROK family protein n=1 Tax=Actinoplanes cyaneus TaxID=52696 RepID=UPI0019429F21|nr:ROK family protein [Actinoplanes cyaneus]
MAGRRVHLVRRDLIFAAVREAGRISRADLAKRTGMARMTVTGLVAELLEAGLLAETDATPDGSRPGRPARLLTLGEQAGVVVGAIVGGDGIRIAVADLAGRILDERHHPGNDPAELAELLSAYAGDRVWATVVGLSAAILDGVVQPGTVLPGWAGRAPARELSERLGHRVTVRNGADLCVIGEAAHGVAAGRRDVCYLRVTTGIGCGLMLGGHVHPGATGVAGELGHVQVDETGALCRCGNRGCLETIASTRQILSSLEVAYGEPLTAARAVALSHTDAAVERVLADAGRMLGRVLADLANTVNPELVVLDGPLIEEDGPVLAGVREAMRRYAQPEVAATTEIRMTGLTGRAGLLGAVTLAMRATPVARGDRTLREIHVKVGQHERAVRREVIVDLLRARGATTRSDLARITRLPRAAVTETLTELTRDGVIESCPPPARSGRPSPSFRMAAPPGVVLGMSMDLDGLRAILTDRGGNRLADGFRPLAPGLDGRVVIRAAAEYAAELLAGHDNPAVALSVPSPVHPVTGEFGARSVLPMFSGFSPGELISGMLGCPVVVGNNAQLAALAETRRGAARGARDVLYLKAAQYVGAGIVAGGRSYGGSIGYAGEIGHLTVRDMGPLCVCGRRGCLGAFLMPSYFGALLERPTEERLIALAAEGHGPARRALLDAGRLIGRTVAVVCDLLNPAVVVVGGRFTEPGDQVIEGIRESLRRHCAPSAAAGLTVVRARLGVEAEALGAVESLL